MEKKNWHRIKTQRNIIIIQNEIIIILAAGTTQIKTQTQLLNDNNKHNQNRLNDPRITMAASVLCVFCLRRILPAILNSFVKN